MNSRFSTAVHILTLIASVPPHERVTSEFIAGSVGTNPVVIRRQLALLREAGIVESKGARGGGWTLGRDAATIKLSEVKKALGSETEFRMHRSEPHPNCAVGQNVREVLGQVYSEADAAVMKALRGWTIKDILNSVQQMLHNIKNESHKHLPFDSLPDNIISSESKIQSLEQVHDTN